LSRWLRVSSTLAVIEGGIVTAGCVIWLAATPWNHANVAARSLEAGHPTLAGAFLPFAAGRVRTALSVTCVYAASFVVWRGGSPEYIAEE